MNEAELAQAFLDGCNPERGYGSGTLEVFARWREGVGVKEAAGRLFGGEGSLGNGAAMRVAPVAVLFADSYRSFNPRRRGAHGSRMRTRLQSMLP